MVGAPGGFAAGQDSGGEDHGTAVRRDGDFLEPAERHGGHVGVQRRHQVHRRGAGSVGQQEQVVPLAVLPRIPVPEHQFVVGPAGGHLLRLGGLPFDGAGDAQTREHLHHQQERLDLRHDLEVADRQRQRGDGHRFAAGRVQQPARFATSRCAWTGNTTSRWRPSGRCGRWTRGWSGAARACRRPRPATGRCGTCWRPRRAC